ncbi:unnamed protein product [Brachionus calyciflorus]|uniref:Insulin-like growth factor-binding complex acid labile subunit n=1 Tax=Brachionus calyciflorus TaxID=104777 RepID=A0A814GUM9_9BILA|nr:unnamed protein product [Brachionus calyciflorus]
MIISSFLLIILNLIKIIKLQDLIIELKCLESKCLCELIDNSTFNIQCNNQLLKFDNPLNKILSYDHQINKFLFNNSQFLNSQIPNGFFEHLRINELIINNSRINSILNKSFIGLFQINKIIFNGLNLSHFESESFLGLNISDLDLVNCNIDDKFMQENSHALKNLKTLDHFTLTHNKITYLDHKWFSNLKITSLFNLSHNYIRKIDIDTFKSMTNLQRLNLKFNNFTKCFDQLPLLHLKTSLTRLILSHNKLTCIPVFDRFIRMKILDLSNNQIETLDYNVFQNLINLSVLNLNSNKLRFICSDCFNKNLLYLKLENNYLSRVPNVRHLSSLILLSLKNQNEKLKLINNYQFDRVNSVLNLKVDLDSNDLVYFESKSFCSKLNSYLDNVTFSFKTFINMINLNKCLFSELTHGSNDVVRVFVNDEIKEQKGDNNFCTCNFKNYLELNKIILYGIKCYDELVCDRNETIYENLCSKQEEDFNCENEAVKFDFTFKKIFIFVCIYLLCFK